MLGSMPGGTGAPARAFYPGRLALQSLFRAPQHPPPPPLQGPYTSTVLWDLAVQVSSSEELAALLEAVTPRTLPALRSLALVAEPGDDLAAIRADFATLEHPGITQLTLNSIELAGGFSTLAHLSGARRPRCARYAPFASEPRCSPTARLSLRLHSPLPPGPAGLQILAAWYEEDQGPPLNLGGDLTALSALRQVPTACHPTHLFTLFLLPPSAVLFPALCCVATRFLRPSWHCSPPLLVLQLSSLAVHNLASSEGLTLLSHLTSLSITPQPGSRLTLGGLPALRQLSADLSSSGSSGRELLRRGSVAYVPPANGLGSLSQLELRCFVWGQAPAAAVAAPPAEPAGPPEPEAAEVDEAEAGGVGEGSDSEDEEPGEDDASVASEADVDAFWQDDAASDGGSEAGAEGEDDVLEAMQGDADAGAASEEDGDEEEEVAAEEGEVGGARGGCERDSLARLERCYLSRLLERLPTLTSILLLDYLGPVATLSSKGAGQGGGARAGAGAGSGGGSVWQNTVTRTIGGAVWQRSISEVPAATPGTAGQCDIQYTWQQTDVQ